VINLHTVSSEYSELHCRSGAGRKSGEAEWSSEWVLQKTMSGSGVRTGRSWSVGYRN